MKNKTKIISLIAVLMTLWCVLHGILISWLIPENNALLATLCGISIILHFALAIAIFMSNLEEEK